MHLGPICGAYHIECNGELIDILGHYINSLNPKHRFTNALHKFA